MKSAYTALIADAVVPAVLAICIACVEARNIAWVRGYVRCSGVCLPDIQLITAHSAPVNIPLYWSVRTLKTINPGLYLGTDIPGH